ncbi:MAG: hypothetical protein ACREHV_14900, partial [Rhizomicrobium sp.]
SMSLPFRRMTLTQVAKALFATDERVKKFVAVKAESPERIPNTLRAAWNADEQGWRTEIVARVNAMDDSVQKAWVVHPSRRNQLKK